MFVFYKSCKCDSSYYIFNELISLLILKILYLQHIGIYNKKQVFVHKNISEFFFVFMKDAKSNESIP